MSSKKSMCEDYEKESEFYGSNNSINFLRRVSRADLDYPPLVSTASSLEKEEKLARKLDVLYVGLTKIERPALDVGEQEPGTACGIIASNVERKPDSESENVYEFRLFSRFDDSTQIVMIDQDPLLDPSETNKGGFLVPKRSSNYYFAPRAEGLRRIQFAMAAIDGDTVKRWSRKRAWALEVPWRVLVVKNGEFNGRSKAHGAHRNEQGKSVTSYLSTHLKRPKPGKKKRIRLREKIRTAQAFENQLRYSEELKLQAEKEKRVRRNREKKIKRKMKKVRLRGIINVN